MHKTAKTLCNIARTQPAVAQVQIVCGRGMSTVNTQGKAQSQEQTHPEITRVEKMFQRYWAAEAHRLRNLPRSAEDLNKMSTWEPTVEESLRVEKPVVTIYGGSGFIGKEVVRQLAPTASSIRVAVREPESFNALLAKWTSENQEGGFEKVTAEYANVVDADSVMRSSDGSDYIINLVGINYESDETYVQAHIIGAKNVAHSARVVRAKRVINMSTLWSQLESRSRYADSKYRGEDISSAAFPNTTNLRASWVYGPNDNFLARLFKPSSGTVQTSKNPLLLPFLKPAFTPNCKVQPVYVGDVAAAVAKCLENPNTRGKTIDLAGPEVLTMAQMMKEVAKKNGGVVLPLPGLTSDVLAFILQWLPDPIITRDQVMIMSTKDSITSDNGFQQLGIKPRPMKEALSLYM